MRSRQRCRGRYQGGGAAPRHRAGTHRGGDPLLGLPALLGEQLDIGEQIACEEQPLLRDPGRRLDAVEELSRLSDNDFLADPTRDQIAHESMKPTRRLVVGLGELGVTAGQHAQDRGVVLDQFTQEANDTPVGFSTLPTHGNAATLTYTFNGVTVTKPLVRQTFASLKPLCE